MSSPAGSQIQTQFSRHIESTLHSRKYIETTAHYLLHYHYFTYERSTLLNSIKEIGPINLTKSDFCKINILFLTIDVYSKNKYRHVKR